MDREGEVTKFFCRIFIQGAVFQPTFCAAKTFAESDRVLFIAEFLEQVFYFFDALKGGANDSRGGGGFHSPGFNTF